MAAFFNQFTDQLCSSAFILIGLMFAPCLSADQPYTPKMVNPLTESWRWNAIPELGSRGVSCFEEDSSGAMWFGVDTGLVKYDGIQLTEYSKADGVPGVVTGLCKLENQMFAHTRDRLFVFSDGRWKRVFPFSNRLQWIIQDLSPGSDGSLWVATNWGALQLRFDHRTGTGEVQQTTLFATREIASAAKRIFAETNFNTVIVDAADKKSWKLGAGILVYGPVPDGQTIIAVAPDGPADQAGLKVGDQIVSVNGKKRESLYQRDIELDSSTILEFDVKRPGNKDLLAFAVVCREVSGSGETFRPYCIAEDNFGRVWFATRLGKMISMETGPDGATTWLHHTRTHGLKPVAAPSLTVTRTGIAVVGRSSNERLLIQLEGEVWRTLKLPRVASKSIIETKDGILLVGGAGQVTSIDGTEIRTHATSKYGIHRNHVIVKQTSDNAIWIVGDRSRVLRIEPPGETYASFLRLNFCDRDAIGNDWFISNSLQVICRSDERWRSFDSSDGLMEIPLAVLATKSGEVWAAGSHHGVAATARFQDGRWELKEHPKLAWSISPGAIFEDNAGCVWFGAAHSSPPESDCLGGVVRFDGQRWKHFVPGHGMTFVTDMAQTRDGTMWFVGESLAYLLSNETNWRVDDVPTKASKSCNSICTDQGGDLWIGSRYFGVGRMDGNWATDNPTTRQELAWYDESAGLTGNDIRDVLLMSDGSIIVSSNLGFNRFDGQGWFPSMLPNEIAQKKFFGGLHCSGDQVWSNKSTLAMINYEYATTRPRSSFDKALFRTVRYRAPKTQPETVVQVASQSTPEGDDFNISWKGTDAFHSTPSEELDFSWRIDEGRWSPFARKTSVRIPGLTAGKHDFQVRARNADFNLDASPAVEQFEVIAPLGRRPWFQLLLLAFAGLVAMFAFQTVRIFRRDASLRAANQKLTDAEQQLRQANVELEDTVVDRTKELRLSNRWLNESEVRFRSIVQDQSEFILRFNARFEIEFANDAFLQSRNYSYEDSTDPFTHSFKSPGSKFLPRLNADEERRVREIVQRLTSAEESSCEIVSVTNLAGEGGWEEWQARELFANNVDGSRVSIGYQAIGRDITDLMQARERLREKEHQLAHLARVATLGEMVAGISHEIKQPLASIANFSTASKLVLDKTEEDQDDKSNLREWIDCISKQTYRIDKIIKSLRRFGRPGSVRTFFPISEAINEALLVTASDSRGSVDQIDIDCSSDLPQVFADQVQIEQVLVNLIRNACEAMHPMRDQTRRIRIEAKAKGDAIVLTVTDSGGGISPELKNDVFHTFVTDKPDGMGVGLAISRSIVEAHGGKIEIVNDEAGGKFAFTLPLESSSVVRK